MNEMTWRETNLDLRPGREGFRFHSAWLNLKIPLTSLIISEKTERHGQMQHSSAGWCFLFLSDFL